MNYKEKLNTLYEKYLGSDEFAYTQDGKPITKKGKVSLYRDEWDEIVEHDLFVGGNIKIATNAKRPGGGYCNDRMCPVHFDGKKPARFLIYKNGVKVMIDGKMYNGDAYRCTKGGEVFIELERDAEPFRENQ